MPLHYGGSINKKNGHLSRKPLAGLNARTQMRIEKLVQIDIAVVSGLTLTNKEIGRALGCSGYLISKLRARKEYLLLRMELTTGISARAEDEVKTFAAFRKQAMVDMLPMAMQIVARTMIDPSTPAALRAKMAIEVMNREGSHPKISRTDVYAKVEHDYSSADGVSAELMQFMSINSSQYEIDPLVLQALNANSAFSNSETISSDMQSRAMKMLELIPEDTTLQREKIS
jgi:hypothetical protein